VIQKFTLIVPYQSLQLFILKSPIYDQFACPGYPHYTGQQRKYRKENIYF
jgi:hypothetical protein